MTIYRKQITIEDPNHVVLSGLPFQAGQRVEIVLTTTESASPPQLTALRSLFKTTQALPQAQAITEAEIAAEIATYRSQQ
jgi:hypothetical protein